MDALALRGDEGRDRLRKATGRCQYSLIRGYPNGATHHTEVVWRSEYIGSYKQTWGTETSKYPEERTSTETPLVVASERGLGQWSIVKNQNCLEKQTKESDSLVWVETQ